MTLGRAPHDPASAEDGNAVDGPTLFARYAYPPNALGYCGPNDDGLLLRRGACGHGVGRSSPADPGVDVTALARAFDGAWPYLEFIADVTGRRPLDLEVVEAYWLGGGLLDKIDLGEYGDDLLGRLRRRAGPSAKVPSTAPADARPDHNFHVFEVYPWMAFLAAGRGGDRPLYVLDRCRIRWGEVLAVDVDRGEGGHNPRGDPGNGPAQCEVRFQPLTWDGAALGLGEAQCETATWTSGGIGFVQDVKPGDQVALHWDWVCDRLDPQRLEDLRNSTVRQLGITNRQAS
ncbi:MAG: DUF6390 family protein [Egibacteraceae bacterium]